MTRGARKSWTDTILSRYMTKGARKRWTNTIRKLSFLVNHETFPEFLAKITFITIVRFVNRRHTTEPCKGRNPKPTQLIHQLQVGSKQILRGNKCRISSILAFQQASKILMTWHSSNLINKLPHLHQTTQNATINR